jgi:hypothetical protein
MNEQARRALEKLKEEKARAKIESELRPAIEQAAVRDYGVLATTLRNAIAANNADSSMKDAGVELVAEGPWLYNDTNYYLLRLHGGKYYPDGSVFLIGLGNATQFDYIKVEIAVWQSHLSMRGLQDNLSSYVPGEEPRRLREYSYKLVQIGNSYAWVKEQRGQINTFKTDELVNEILGDLMVENLPDSR